MAGPAYEGVLKRGTPQFYPNSQCLVETNALVRNVEKHSRPMRSSGILITTGIAMATTPIGKPKKYTYHL